jgi:hypothetical protein
VFVVPFPIELRYNVPYGHPVELGMALQTHFGEIKTNKKVKIRKPKLNRTEKETEEKMVAVPLLGKLEPEVENNEEFERIDDPFGAPVVSYEPHNRARGHMGMTQQGLDVAPEIVEPHHPHPTPIQYKPTQHITIKEATARPALVPTQSGIGEHIEEAPGFIERDLVEQEQAKEKIGLKYLNLALAKLEPQGFEPKEEETDVMKETGPIMEKSAFTIEKLLNQAQNKSERQGYCVNKENVNEGIKFERERFELHENTVNGCANEKAVFETIQTGFDPLIQDTKDVSEKAAHKTKLDRIVTKGNLAIQVNTAHVEEPKKSGFQPMDIGVQPHIKMEKEKEKAIISQNKTRKMVIMSLTDPTSEIEVKEYEHPEVNEVKAEQTIAKQKKTILKQANISGFIPDIEKVKEFSGQELEGMIAVQTEAKPKKKVTIKTIESGFASGLEKTKQFDKIEVEEVKAIQSQLILKNKISNKSIESGFIPDSDQADEFKKCDIEESNASESQTRINKKVTIQPTESGFSPGMETLKEFEEYEVEEGKASESKTETKEIVSIKPIQCGYINKEEEVEKIKDIPDKDFATAEINDSKQYNKAELNPNQIGYNLKPEVIKLKDKQAPQIPKAVTKTQHMDDDLLQLPAFSNIASDQGVTAQTLNIKKVSNVEIKKGEKSDATTKEFSQIPTSTKKIIEKQSDSTQSDEDKHEIILKPAQEQLAAFKPQSPVKVKEDNQKEKTRITKKISKIKNGNTKESEADSIVSLDHQTVEYFLEAPQGEKDIKVNATPAKKRREAIQVLA